MTTLDRIVPTPITSANELVQAQLLGIQRWHAARLATEQAAQARGLSREQRLDATRRISVRQREHEAIVARAALALELAGRPSPVVPARAVVAHRHPWTRERLAHELVAQGVEVLAVVDNGADAVGICVAEQPALLVVDEPLMMASGSEAVTEVRELCPHTVRAGYVGDELLAERLRRAGAVAVRTRQVPPAEVAAELAELLAG